MKRLYVVVRPDLPVGLQMAQACHAVREFTAQHPAVDVGENLVVLHAEAYEIVDLTDRAAREGLAYALFFEPDLPGGQVTAAAFSGDAQKMLSSLPLACRPRAPGGGRPLIVQTYRT